MYKLQQELSDRGWSTEDQLIEREVVREGLGWRMSLSYSLSNLVPRAFPLKGCPSQLQGKSPGNEVALFPLSFRFLFSPSSNKEPSQ